MSMTSLHECDCLVQFDPALPHYADCKMPGLKDGTAVRTLAELAAFRDIDAALECLRQATGRPAGRKAVRR